MSTPSLNVAFATPIGKVRHPEAATLNQSLKALFLQWEANPDRENAQRAMQNFHQVFESDFSLFSVNEQPIQELKQFCFVQLMRFLETVTQVDASYLQAKVELQHHSWFHITRNQGFFGIHNHPMASWSGVYCVDDGGAAGPDVGGILRFHDPRGSHNMFLDPANARMKPAFSQATLNYKLEAGDLLLFPSSVMHEVTPYLGDATRITVAFNSWTKLRS